MASLKDWVQDPHRYQHLWMLKGLLKWCGAKPILDPYLLLMKMQLKGKTVVGLSTSLLLLLPKQNNHLSVNKGFLKQRTRRCELLA